MLKTTEQETLFPSPPQFSPLLPQLGGKCLLSRLGHKWGVKFEGGRTERWEREPTIHILHGMSRQAAKSNWTARFSHGTTTCIACNLPPPPFSAPMQCIMMIISIDTFDGPIDREIGIGKIHPFLLPSA